MLGTAPDSCQLSLDDEFMCAACAGSVELGMRAAFSLQVSTSLLS